MRKIVILLTLLIIMTNCGTTSKFAAVQPAPPANPEESTWLLGYFNPDTLKQGPYASWYNTGYEDYQINSGPVNNLLDISKENISMKIIMGTWCPDSRREVPRMMRILEIWGMPMSKVTFIGVDRKKNATVKDYSSLNIEKVPTFIIYKNNIEAGRIIETPKTSLEQDMVNILTGHE
jgi:hypothetical protein